MPAINAALKKKLLCIFWSTQGSSYTQFPGQGSAMRRNGTSLDIWKRSILNRTKRNPRVLRLGWFEKNCERFAQATFLSNMGLRSRYNSKIFQARSQGDLLDDHVLVNKLRGPTPQFSGQYLSHTVLGPFGHLLSRGVLRRLVYRPWLYRTGECSGRP